MFIILYLHFQFYDQAVLNIIEFDEFDLDGWTTNCHAGSNLESWFII